MENYRCLICSFTVALGAVMVYDIRLILLKVEFIRYQGDVFLRSSLGSLVIESGA